MRTGLSSRSAVPSVLVALVLAGWAGSTAAAAGPWDLASVLPFTGELPGLAGTRIREVGRLWAVDAETFVVWARVEGSLAGWVLLGFRLGKAEVVAVEKVSSEARDGAVLAVRRQESGMGARLGQGVVAGRGLVYLQEKPLEAVPAGGTNPVYVWDAQGLRRLLGPGDEIPFRGTMYRCESVTLGHANAGGTVLLAFTAASPARVGGLAVHDGKELRGVMTEDQPLPGTSDARFKDSALGCGTVRLEEAVLADDGTVVLVGYVKSAGATRKGILAVGETFTEMLVAGGEPCPVGGGGKVRSCPFKLFDARSVGRVVAGFTCREPVAAVWDRTRWTAVDAGSLGVEQAVLVSREGTAVLWQGSAEREERRGGEVRRLHAEGWGVFVGDRSRDLRLDGHNPTGFDFVVRGGGAFDLLLQYGWGVQGLPDGFLDGREPAAGVRMAPTFPTSAGGSVSLGDVLAWLDDEVALVVVRGPGFAGPPVSPGIYRMTRPSAS